MPVYEVTTSEEFYSYLDNEDSKQSYIFVDFYASWCGPCKRISPFLEKLSDNEKYSSILFLKLNVDDVEDVTRKYNVTALPTFLIFDRGNRESIYNPIVGANTQTIEERLGCLVETKPLEINNNF